MFLECPRNVAERPGASSSVPEQSRPESSGGHPTACPGPSEVVREPSEAVRGRPELSGSARKLSGAIPGRLDPPGIVREPSGNRLGRPGTLRSHPNLFPSRI